MVLEAADRPSNKQYSNSMSSSKHSIINATTRTIEDTEEAVDDCEPLPVAVRLEKAMALRRSA